MCEFVPGVSASGEDVGRRGWTSPDRMDALVWAAHELFLNDEQVADYSAYTAENVARFEHYMMRQMGVSPEAFIPPGLRRWPW